MIQMRNRNADDDQITLLPQSSHVVSALHSKVSHK